MNAKLLSLIALAAVVNAQVTTSAPGGAVPPTTATSVSGASTTTDGTPTPTGLPADLPVCVQTCITQAATSAGCNAIDVACGCSNVQFQTEAVTCLQDCTAEEQAAAIALQQQQCGATTSDIESASTVASNTATSPAGSVSTTPGSITRTVSSTRATSSTATQSGNAANTSNAAAPLALNGIWAMVAGVLGFAVAL